MPVRTHCHPLIGSFLIPPTTRCQPIDGEMSGCQEPARPRWHGIKAGTNAARRQSGKPEHTQAQEHPKTWPHRTRLYHRGVIGTWAFRSTFKGGILIHMCTMKLAILYPASPPLPPLHFLSLSCPPPLCKTNRRFQQPEYVLFSPASSATTINRATRSFSAEKRRKKNKNPPEVWPRCLRLWRRTRVPNLRSCARLDKISLVGVCLWLSWPRYVCLR